MTDTTNRAGSAPQVARLAVVCLVSFIALAAAVTTGALDTFDITIFSALAYTPVEANADPSFGSVWLQEVAAELTTLGGFPFIVVLIGLAAGYLVMSGHRAAAAFMVTSIATGALASFGLKLLFSRPRPTLVGHLDTIYSSSFPSGHATASALTYLTIAVVLMRFSETTSMRYYTIGAATLLALLVGATRVYLGVHWPTDVVGGWLLGTGWACCAWLTAHWMTYRGGANPDLGSSEPVDTVGAP